MRREVGPAPVVEAIDLYKSYGKVRALNGLTLRVMRGEIFGLIGPNGAGKTTTLKIFAGLLRPDRGTAKICGHDVVKDRVRALMHVGYVPENPVVFQNLTLRQFVLFVATLRGIPREIAEERLSHYLDVFELWHAEDKLLGEFSRGMLQKALVTAAFVVKPDVLLLDEPMSGMDPAAQHAFKQEVKRMVAEGATVIISSHLLDLVERFCTRVGLIYRGKLLLEGTIDEVKRKVAESEDATLEEVYLKVISSEGGR